VSSTCFSARRTAESVATMVTPGSGLMTTRGAFSASIIWYSTISASDGLPHVAFSSGHGLAGPRLAAACWSVMSVRRGEVCVSGGHGLAVPQFAAAGWGLVSLGFEEVGVPCDLDGHKIVAAHSSWCYTTTCSSTPHASQTVPLESPIWGDLRTAAAGVSQRDPWRSSLMGLSSTCRPIAMPLARFVTHSSQNRLLTRSGDDQVCTRVTFCRHRLLVLSLRCLMVTVP
jgi:hypothetical protein